MEKMWSLDGFGDVSKYISQPYLLFVIEKPTTERKLQKGLAVLGKE